MAIRDSQRREVGAGEDEPNHFLLFGEAVVYAFHEGVKAFAVFTLILVLLHEYVRRNTLHRIGGEVGWTLVVHNNTRAFP